MKLLSKKNHAYPKRAFGILISGIHGSALQVNVLPETALGI
jgi:hypothetical protein